MTRSDRSWTAVIAECGLDRAQPLLAGLAANPFARINLARALAATGVLPDRSTPFAAHLEPKLAQALGADHATALDALARLPFDAAANPVATVWRGLLRDLHGPNAPNLPPTEAAFWAAFSDAFRGRAIADPTDPPWLHEVAAGAQSLRDLSDLATTQRALALTPHDRSLYARFGWNDDGDIPGLTGLLNAAALLRTRSAWAAVAHLFDAPAQAAIEAAATRLAEAERAAAMAGLDDDVRRYGVPRAQLAAALYPARLIPPLIDLLAEEA